MTKTENRDSTKMSRIALMSVSNASVRLSAGEREGGRERGGREGGRERGGREGERERGREGWSVREKEGEV